MRQRNIKRYVVPGLLALLSIIGIACGGSAAPTVTPAPVAMEDPRIDEILMVLDMLGERLIQVEESIAAISARMPTPTPHSMMEEPAPTLEMMMEEPNIQEIAIIENYAATRFFPQWMVVLKDKPVRIYLTRLHKEHVNKFTIAPFYDSSEVILPGEIGVIEFVPDQVGEFKIRNVGHNFEATLVVVETVQEANILHAERGKQMYALIHSVDEFQIFPDRLTIKKDIPATVHNISLIAEHQVSFKPFHDPEDFNVRPRQITPIKFTPDKTGEFTILHELHGITGDLVVEEVE